MKFAVLMSSFNRSSKTLNCIKTLHKQYEFLDFYLVDDNSSDSTVDQVSLNYPDVNIIMGDGSLFWAGAMRYGWNEIDHSKYEALIVVNDDVDFYEDAVSNAINQYKELKNIKRIRDFALVGSTHYFNQVNEVSYGGQKRSSIWHPLKFSLIQPSNSLIEADTLNMNFAIIPIRTINQYGFLAEYFIHGGADFEFGLRLRMNNVKIFVMSGFVGRCDRNPEKIFTGSLMNRLKQFNDAKVQPFSQRYKYFKIYGGYFWLILFSLSYLKLFFAFNVRRKNREPT